MTDPVASRASGDPRGSTGEAREVPGHAQVFSQIDFPSLWRGREATTRAEARALGELLGPTRWQRILEVGTGEGRLTPVLRGWGSEYVGVDGVPEFVARIDLGSSPTARRLAANLFHLPFRDGAFDAVAMVRVLDFLPRPSAAFTELTRVLAPGGRLVVSFHPRPSFETLYDDVRKGLKGRDPARPPSLTFSRLGPAPVLATGTAAYPPSRSEVRAGAEATGLLPHGVRDLGFEDFRLTNWLPASTLRGLGELLGPVGVPPVRFAAWTRPGRSEGLPAMDRILACPRCHAAPSAGGWGFETPGRCAECGWRAAPGPGIVDARYSPEPTPP